jgi:hypothetical protein
MFTILFLALWHFSRPDLQPLNVREHTARFHLRQNTLGIHQQGYVSSRRLHLIKKVTKYI